MNKVRFTWKTGPELRAEEEDEPWSAGPSYQVVLFVVHLGRVSPHAVDGQQKVHEGEGGVQPEEVGPGHRRGVQGSAPGAQTS